MAMLSDRQLFDLAENQGIVEPFIKDNCEGATINLTLSPSIVQYKSDKPIVLGTKVADDRYKKIDIQKEDFFLAPGSSVLIQTNEKITVPENISARMYERFGVKSLGLVISPAHYINPGYSGQISFLAVNNSPVPIQLTAGIKICQIGFFELTSDPLKPYEKQSGLYMYAKEVSTSKLHLDKEIKEFLHQKGIEKVSDNMAKDLSEHLMGHIRNAAKDLAELARQEFEKDKNLNE